MKFGFLVKTPRPTYVERDIGDSITVGQPYQIQPLPVMQNYNAVGGGGGGDQIMAKPQKKQRNLVIFKYII